MKTIIRNHHLELDPIAWLRSLILEYVRKNRYFVPYAYLAEVTGWSQPQLWKHLDEMGDQDVLEGRPRTDAFVGKDEPSNGHYNKKKYSKAYVTRWQRIEYLTNEIIQLCNHYRLYFLEKLVQANGTIKAFLKLQGMWYENNYRSEK